MKFPIELGHSSLHKRVKISKTTSNLHEDDKQTLILTFPEANPSLSGLRSLFPDIPLPRSCYDPYFSSHIHKQHVCSTHQTHMNMTSSYVIFSFSRLISHFIFAFTSFSFNILERESCS